MERRFREGEMTALWFETALLPDGWTTDVRINHASGVITAVESGVAPERPATSAPRSGFRA